MDITCTHAAAGFSLTTSQIQHTPRMYHPLGALLRPRRPVGRMRHGSGMGAPGHGGAHSGGDPPQTAPTAPSAPRRTDAEGTAPLAAGSLHPRPNAPPNAGGESSYVLLLGCYPGWQRAGSLRRRRRAPPKAAQTPVSPERNPALGTGASAPTLPSTSSRSTQPPFACCGPAARIILLTASPLLLHTASPPSLQCHPQCPGSTLWGCCALLHVASATPPIAARLQRQGGAVADGVGLGRCTIAARCSWR